MCVCVCVCVCVRFCRKTYESFNFSLQIATTNRPSKCIVNSVIFLKFFIFCL